MGSSRNPCKRSRTGALQIRLGNCSWAHMAPKWDSHYDDSGCAQDAQALLRLCSGLPAPSSGKSGRDSCPETKSEPARGKIYIEFIGIF